MANPTNPTGIENVNELPNDAVALIVWRKDFGPQPLTIIVSRASYDKNKKLLDDKKTFDTNMVWDFESPINEKGRKSVFSLSGVTGWVANLHTGIVPPGNVKV